MAYGLKASSCDPLRKRPCLHLGCTRVLHFSQMLWKEPKIDQDEKAEMMRGKYKESSHPVMGILTYFIRYTLQLASAELYSPSITN